MIIAELGVDMKVFGNVTQLASWAGICPGSNESAGKPKSSCIPKGNVYLKTALVEAANAAARAKGTYLRDKFFRASSNDFGRDEGFQSQTPDGIHLGDEGFDHG